MSVAFQTFDRELIAETLTAFCPSTTVKLIKWLVLSILRAKHAFVLSWFGAFENFRAHGKPTSFFVRFDKIKLPS